MADARINPDAIQAQEQKVSEEILSSFGNMEYIAHELAYQQKGHTGLLTSEQAERIGGNYFCQHVATIPGLVCYILTPDYKETPNSNTLIDVKIVFRGTADQVSALRDLELRAPGHDSFAASWPKIEQAINEKIESLPAGNKEISLTIYGHSLGGADAQNCYVKLMQATAEAYQNDNLNLKLTPLSRVAKLNLAVCSSAGVTRATADTCKELVARLKNYNVKMQADFLHAAGDLVQQTGEANLFAGISQEEGVVVRLLKVHNKPIAEGIWLDTFNLITMIQAARNVLDAHTIKYFAPANREREFAFDLYENSTPEATSEMAKKLLKKASSFQNSQVKALQSAIYHSLSALVPAPAAHNKQYDEYVLVDVNHANGGVVITLEEALLFISRTIAEKAAPQLAALPYNHQQQAVEDLPPFVLPVEIHNWLNQLSIVPPANNQLPFVANEKAAPADEVKIEVIETLSLPEKHKPKPKPTSTSFVTALAITLGALSGGLIGAISAGSIVTAFALTATILPYLMPALAFVGMLAFGYFAYKFSTEAQLPMVTTNEATVASKPSTQFKSTYARLDSHIGGLTPTATVGSEPAVYAYSNSELTSVYSHLDRSPTPHPDLLESKNEGHAAAPR